MKNLTGLLFAVETKAGGLGQLGPLAEMGSICNYTDSFQAPGIQLVRNIANQKFKEEKIFEQDHEWLIAIDGHILNLKALKNKYAAPSTFELIKMLHKQLGELFVQEVEGDFCIALYNKATGNFKYYSSHVGTYTLFYTYHNGVLIAATDLPVLTKFLLQSGLPCTFSEYDAHFFLTYCHMLTNRTLVKEVKRIVPGEFIVVNNNQFELKKHFELNSFPQLNLSKEEILNDVEERMVYAVKSQYEKNQEYGYEFVSTLSGGLDSRMGLIMGHELGYKNLKAFTFSVSNTWEVHIAQTICKELGIKHQFVDLKNGSYLSELERPLEIQNAQIFYSSASHTMNALDRIDLSKAGIINTGQIGDAVLGSKLFHKESNHYPANSYFLRVRSRKALDDTIMAAQHEFGTRYDSAEICNMYNTGCNFVVGGNWVIHQTAELDSPFLHKKVWAYCMSIPLPLRNEHRLYTEWVERFHPLAGKFRYASTKRRTVPHRGPFPKRKLLNVMDKIGSILLDRSLTKEMIPVDKWFNENTQLRATLDDKFTKGIASFEGSDELKNKLKMFYNTGSYYEKSFALSVIYGQQILFG